jgi:hypothetical protein
MIKVFFTLVTICLLTSCSVYEKNVELVDGTFITQKKYDRIIRKVSRDAERSANKVVRKQLSRKQAKNLFKDTNITIEVKEENQ